MALEIILPVYRVYFRMKRYVFHLDARQGLRFEICVISVSPYTALFPYPKFLRKDLSRTLPWPRGYPQETLQGNIYYAELNTLTLIFSNLLEISIVLVHYIIELVNKQVTGFSKFIYLFNSKLRKEIFSLILLRSTYNFD